MYTYNNNNFVLQLQQHLASQQQQLQLYHSTIYIYVYMNNRYINQQQTTIKIDAARRTDHTTQSKPIAKTYLPNYL